MTKAEIRRLYKASRAALTGDQVAQLSQQIAARFFADDQLRTYLAQPSAVLHTYLPIRRQHEVDTWPIIRRIWAEWPRVPVLASVTNAPTHTMLSFELTPDTLLTENRWGIPEPTVPITPAGHVPTLVLVPLLAFDERGHRVGYGGGYYDRFLAGLPGTCLKIGLSLFGPVAATDDIMDTDIRLNGVLEPTRSHWING